MRIARFTTSLLLMLSLLFCSISVMADAYEDDILTLEEAKALALKNNVQYNLQQFYIDQAKENYDEVYNDNTGTSGGKKSVAAKAAEEISQDMAIENAASGVRKAVFNREDMKRTSDYSVTEAYYSVIKAMHSLVYIESEMKLKKNDLEAARVKYGLNLITQSSLFQAESSYTTSQTNYSNALSELQICIMQLGKCIVKELDASNCRLDMALDLPDIESLDQNKIKEGYLKNNSSYFSAKEQYELAKYKLQSTQQNYDDYYDKMKASSETVRDEFDNMLYDAQRDFTDAEYTYKDKLSDLDTAISNQYSSIKNLYESYENQKKAFEDAKLSAEESRIKYQMGLVTKAALESSLTDLHKLESQLVNTITSLNIQYLNMKQYCLE